MKLDPRKPSNWRLALSRHRHVTSGVAFARKIAPLLAAFVSVLSEATEPPSWQTEGFNPQRSSFVPITLGECEAVLLWERGFSAETNPVVVGEGAVYAVPDGRWEKIGQVWAINMYSGDILWSRSFQPEPHSMNPPCLADGVLYFQRGNQSSDSQIWAVDAKTGEPKWNLPYHAQWDRFRAPFAVDGTLFATSRSRLHLIDAVTGEERDSLNVTLGGRLPAYENGTLYLSLNGVFSEIDANTLQTLRTFSIGGTTDFSSPSIGETRIFVAKNDTLYALDKESFSLAWSYSGSTPPSIPTGGGQVFVHGQQTVLALNAETGELEATYEDPEARSSGSLIVTEDKVIRSTWEKTFVFDRQSGLLEFTIDAGGSLSLAGRTLYTTRGKLKAWQFKSLDSSSNTPPIGANDHYSTTSGSSLIVSATESGGPLSNDWDVDGDSFTANLQTGPGHGSVELQADGSFTYTPNPEFEGVDAFYYQVSDAKGTSLPTRVEIDVLSQTDPYITISVSQNGLPIDEGSPVSGTIEGEITVYNCQGQHAQLYKNFRILHSKEHGHSIDSNIWKRTFTLDTTQFFDGENLISVHAHPHNHDGHPYSVDFTVGTFKIVSENENPSPNGDTKLPTLDIDPQLIEVRPAHLQVPGAVIDADWNNAFTLKDDGDPIDIDQTQSKSLGGQVIAHIGASVLGRFRWGSASIPFAERGVFDDVHVFPFQTTTEREARIVFFLNDEIGRANYAFHTVTLPPITMEEKMARPIDAKILNLQQGDSLTLINGESFEVEIEVSHPHSEVRGSFNHLFLWVGNRSVAKVDLGPYWDELNPSDTSFVVKIPIPYHQISVLEAARTVSKDSAAFAIWLDFSTGRVESNNLPTSEHVHLTQISTEGRPRPFGPPSLSVASLQEDLIFSQEEIRFDLLASGELPENYSIRYQVDSGDFKDLVPPKNEVVLSSLVQGAHSVRAFIVDSEGVQLANPENEIEFTVRVANRISVASYDRYQTYENEPLVIDQRKGVLANDSDPDKDALNAILLEGPQHGQLTLQSDGSFTYLPDEGFTGADHFLYASDDGTDRSNPSRTHITVASKQLSPQPTVWSTLAGNSGHNSSYPSRINSRTPIKLWERTLGRPEHIKPLAIADGKVFAVPTFYNSAHIVYALNSKTGETLWTYRLGSENLSHSGPSYANGLLYIVTSNTPQLTAINASDGKLAWNRSFSASNDLHYPPTLFEDKLAVPSRGNGGMAGFDANTGEPLFTNASVPEIRWWTPAYHHGKLYSWVNGVLREHDPATGEELRSHTVFNFWIYESEKNLVALNDGIAFVSGRGALVAIDLETFEKLWFKRDLDTQTPTVSNGQVFARNNYGYHAFDTRTGELQQTFNPKSYLYDSQTIATTDKLIICTKSVTHIHDRTSGKLIYTIEGAGVPSLADGILYLASQGDDGIVQAWDLGSPERIKADVDDKRGIVEYHEFDNGETIDSFLSVHPRPGFEIQAILFNGNEIELPEPSRTFYQTNLRLQEENVVLSALFRYSKEAGIENLSLAADQGTNTLHITVFGKSGHTYVLQVLHEIEGWTDTTQSKQGEDAFLHFEVQNEELLPVMRVVQFPTAQ